MSSGTSDPERNHMLMSKITWNVQVSSNQNAKYEIAMEMKNLISMALKTSNSDNAQPDNEICEFVSKGMNGMSIHVAIMTPMRSAAPSAAENPKCEIGLIRYLFRSPFLISSETFFSIRPERMITPYKAARVAYKNIESEE